MWGPCTSDLQSGPGHEGRSLRCAAAEPQDAGGGSRLCACVRVATGLTADGVCGGCACGKAAWKCRRVRALGGGSAVGL
jgi:hypothetical protein